MRIGLIVVSVVAAATALSQAKPALSGGLLEWSLPSVGPNEPPLLRGGSRDPGGGSQDTNKSIVSPFPNEPSNNTAPKIKQPTSESEPRAKIKSESSWAPNEPSRQRGAEGE